MPPTRRATLALPILAAAAVLALAACGDAPRPPSGAPPTSPPSTRPPASGSAASRTPIPSAAPAGPFPVLLIRADEPDGLHWYATLPGDPSHRRPLSVPPDVQAIGPANTDGMLVLMSSVQLRYAAFDGNAVIVTRSIELDELGLTAGEPACFGPDRRLAVADPETLALTVILADRTPVAIDVPDALGECAWLGDGRLLVVREGDRLAAADPTTGLARAVTGGTGRHPSIAAGLLSLVDRSGPASVPLRDGSLGGPGGLALGPTIFAIEAVSGELIPRAGFSPDGGWLAVEVILDPESAAVRRLRLYRVGEGSLDLVIEIGLGPREQITLLPAP